MKSNLYFKHDIYAIENDEGLRYVCSEYPVWGEAVFFRAVTIMFRKNGEPCLSKILVNDIAHELFTDNKDKVSEIINNLIDLNVFKKSEDGKIYSERIQRECEKRTEFSEKQRRNISKRWEKDIKKEQIESPNNTSGIPMEYQPKYDGNTYKQEQEQDNKEKEILSNDNIPKKKVCSDLLFSPEKEKDTTPYDDIITYWNKGAVKVGFSQFTKMTEQRKRAICSRWNEYGEKVYEAMDKVFASDFCKSGSWCGFDWVFKPSNMVKVLEGNYDNRTSSRGFKKDVTGRYDNLESEVIEL